MTMLDVILLRHPETAWNREKILQGQSDIPALDPTVSDELARQIVELGFVAAVYTSDLQRCSEPAFNLHRKIAAQTSLPVPYSLTPLLRERNFGSLEGKPYDILGHDSVESVGNYLYHLEIPDGEGKDASRARAADALRSLLYYQVPQMTTVVVAMTHGCFMNYMLTELEGNVELSPYRPSGNLSGFRVRVGDDKLVKDIIPFPEVKP
jgi:broad specificity phosphatase PhoE